MKVLITGADGFVGSAIASKFTAKNWQVIRSGRRGDTTSLRAVSKPIEDEDIYIYIKVDITKPEDLEQIASIQGIDAVIHSAGLAHQFGDTEKQKFEQVNVEGTKNILRAAAAANVKKFILISTTAVYGIKKTLPNGGNIRVEDSRIVETSECRPENAYAESKLQAELAAIEFCRRHEIDLTILRLAPVLGENNVGNAARLIEAIDKNRFLWVGSGDNLKTLVYKNDVAEACYRILTLERKGAEIFNLAGDPIKMKDFVEIIARSLNKKIPKIRIPKMIFEALFNINSKTFGLKKIDKLAKTMEKWLSDDVYSADKLRRFYNFKAETPIPEAVELQVRAYRAEK